MSKKFSGLLAAMPGNTIFGLTSQPLFPGSEKKPIGTRLAEEITHIAIKSVFINEAKIIQLAGGKDALVLNGGTAGLTFGENENLISSIDGVTVDTFTKSEEEGAKSWFGNYETVKALARVSNNSEISRLKTIIKECNEAIGTLEAINQANEDATERYK